MRKWLLVLAMGIPAFIQAAECYDPCCAPFLRGFYIGGNVGFATHFAERVDLDHGFFAADTLLETATDWAAGVQVGYDLVCRNTVVGLIADWQWTDLTTKLVFSPHTPPVSASFKGHMHWFTTFRAKGGFTLNDVAFYITGGWAAADLKSFFAHSGVFPHRQSFTHYRWGWTAGFGSEFYLCNNLSLTAEVLYMRFQTKGEEITIVNPQPKRGSFMFNFYDEVWCGRMGLNYRFSWLSLW